MHLGGDGAGREHPRATRALTLGPCVVLALLLTVAARPAGAEVFMTREQALAEAFPNATLERRAIVLDARQSAAVQKRAGAKLESRVAGAYVATRGDSLLGTAFFDSRRIRTMPGTFMIVIAPDTTVARVEMLAFHEPPDYRPPARWLGLFRGRPLSNRLWPKREIRNLSGASLTAYAVTESVRLSLALYEIVVAPTLAREIPE
jgi:hypothetical protein